MAAQVTKDERIFSLILALVASRDGLTKQQILSTVHGYASEFSTGKNLEALERKFERDKGEIRDMGVNIEILEPVGAAGVELIVAETASLGPSQPFKVAEA